MERFYSILEERGYRFKNQLPGRYDVIAAISQWNRKDPGIISAEIGNFIQDNYADPNLRNASGVEMDNDMLDRQFEYFMVGGGIRGNAEIACYAFSMIYKKNVVLFRPNKRSRCFPDRTRPFNKNVYIANPPTYGYHLLEKGETDVMFRARLDRSGYVVIDVIGDGNCMYTAISMCEAVQDDEQRVKTQKDIRREIATYLRTHINDESLFMFYDSIDTKKGRKEKINVIENIKEDPKAWGDMLTIQAAIRLYHINVSIFMPFLPEPDFIRNPESDECPTLYLSYHNNNHYNFLRPKNGAEKVADDGHVKEKPKGKSKVMEEFNFFIIMLGKSEQADTIPAMLQITGCFNMYLLVDIDGSFRKRLFSDRDIHKYATVWHMTFQTFGDTDDNLDTLSQLMMLPLIMNISHKKWLAFDINFLFPVTPSPTLMELLKSSWPKIRDQVERDSKLISSTPHYWACSTCKKDCPYKSKPWHLDLSAFKKIKLPDNATSNTSFFKEFLFAYGSDMGSSSFLDAIKTFYWSQNTDIVEAFQCVDTALTEQEN